MSEEKKDPTRISRREFLKDAGIVVGGTAVSSAFLLTACNRDEVTKTVTTTTTAPGTTSTVTTTAACGTATKTQTVS